MFKANLTFADANNPKLKPAVRFAACRAVLAAVNMSDAERRQALIEAGAILGGNLQEPDKEGEDQYFLFKDGSKAKISSLRPKAKQHVKRSVIPHNTAVGDALRKAMAG